MSKYYGDFSSRQNVIDEFFPYNESTPPEGFPTEEAILIAYYDRESYEGTANVFFTRDGKLYEVSGGHCSCYGLEDQWTPTEVTWEALAMRPHYVDEFHWKAMGPELEGLGCRFTELISAGITK